MAQLQLPYPQQATITFDTLDLTDVSALRLTPKNFSAMASFSHMFSLEEGSPMVLPETDSLSGRPICAAGLELRESFQKAADLMVSEGHYLTKLPDELFDGFDMRDHRHKVETWINESALQAVQIEKRPGLAEEMIRLQVGNCPPYAFLEKEHILDLISRFEARVGDSVFKYVSGLAHSNVGGVTTYLSVEDIKKVNLDCNNQGARLIIFFGERQIIIEPALLPEELKECMKLEDSIDVIHQRMRDNAISIRNTLREKCPNAVFTSQGEDEIFRPWAEVVEKANADSARHAAAMASPSIKP